MTSEDIKHQLIIIIVSVDRSVKPAPSHVYLPCLSHQRYILKNKDASPGMPRVNTRYINSTRGTSLKPSWKALSLVVSVDYVKLHSPQTHNSGAVWKSRWTSWAPVPNKPTISVDVKQHFDSNKNILKFSMSRPGVWPRGKALGWRWALPGTSVRLNALRLSFFRSCGLVWDTVLWFCSSQSVKH